MSRQGHRRARAHGFLRRWGRFVSGASRFLVDGVYNSELMAPYDIFQHTIFHTDPGMETFTVRRGPSFVHDGPAITSQGGAKSYDLAMYLVALVYGDGSRRGSAGGSS